MTKPKLQKLADGKYFSYTVFRGKARPAESSTYEIRITPETSIHRLGKPDEKVALADWKDKLIVVVAPIKPEGSFSSGLPKKTAREIIVEDR